jgi:hypothetical protein
MPMRRSLLAIVAAALGGVASAADKGTEVALGGLKSTTPAAWKEKELPKGSMRMAQFTVPKAEGDKDDAEVAIFVFPGGSGTVKQNLERQLAKFVADGRKETVDKIKVGDLEATYQDVTGTFLKKPFPMAEKGTPVEGYRQLYVVFEAGDGKQYYLWLLGPAKTVGDHKKGFDEFLKGFK